MSPALTLLGRVLQDRPHAGVVVVLSGDTDEESQERLASVSGPYVIPVATNTHEDALWTRRNLETGDDLVLVTSAYHQLRAFLTFVRVFRGTAVRIWNAPAPSEWGHLVDEARKIAAYQRKGHVASYAEGLAYLAQRSTGS
jgi:hypothetical protein